MVFIFRWGLVLLAYPSISIRRVTGIHLITTFSSQLKFDENYSLFSSKVSNKVLATQSCTWHNSVSGMACAKHCYNLAAMEWITANEIFIKLNCDWKTFSEIGPGIPHQPYLVLKLNFAWQANSCHYGFLFLFPLSGKIIVKFSP